MLGCVGIVVSLEPARAQLAVFRHDGDLAVTLKALAILSATYVYLANALAPLGRLVRFAGAMPMNPGSALHVPGGSMELRELATALNDASAMLRSQLDTVAREQGALADAGD